MKPTVYQIATCQKNQFLEFVAQFESNIKVKYQFTHLFQDYPIQQDFLIEPELKFKFLQSIQNFLDHQITENNYYNSKLSKIQNQATQNTLVDSMFSDESVFSFVKDDVLYSDVTCIQALIQFENIDILSQINRFSFKCIQFSLNLNTQFCHQMYTNDNYLDNNVFLYAFSIQNFDYFQSLQSIQSNEKLQSLLQQNTLVTQCMKLNCLIQQLSYEREVNNDIYEVYQAEEVSFDSIMQKQKDESVTQNEPEDEKFIDEDNISNAQELSKNKDYILDLPILKDISAQNLYQNYGFFAPSDANFQIIQNLEIKQLGELNQYQQSIKDHDQAQFLLLMKTNIGIRHGPITGIHLAIMFNNMDAFKILIKQEKFSTTNSFYIQIPSGLWVLVPEKATCLHLVVLFEQYSLVNSFIEQAVQPANGIYPLDYAGFFNFLNIWKPGKTEYLNNLDASIYSNNQEITIQLLQFDIISKEELTLKCRQILEKENWSSSEELILVYGHQQNIVIGDYYQKLEDVYQQYLPDFSQFQSIFGVMIGRLKSYKTNYFTQTKEINLFFDQCINGDVSENDLRRNGNIYDKRLSTNKIVMGFTGYHYVEYYGHKQYKNILNQRSNSKTVIRFNDFDILMDQGIKVSELGGRLYGDQSSISIIPQLKGKILDSINIHFYCFMQQNMKILEDYIMTTNQQTQLLQQLITKVDEHLPVQILQYNINSQQILNRLTNSAYVFYGMKNKEDFEQETLVLENDFIKLQYQLNLNQFLLPEICQFDCQEQFLDECKSSQIKNIQQKDIKLVEQRTTNLSQQIYSGFIGIFYAIYCSKLENIKILLERQWNINISKDIVIQKLDKYLFVPQNFQALHFAQLIDSPFLGSIETFYKAKQLDYLTSYCALCICKDFNFNKKFIDYEQDSVFMMQQIIYSCVLHQKIKQLEFILNSSVKQNILIQVLTTEYDGRLIINNASNQCKFLIEKFVAQKMFQQNFDSKFCLFYKKETQQDLIQLFLDYRTPSVETSVSFNFNSIQQSVWFDQALQLEKFDNSLVKFKNTFDTRKTDQKKIIYGFSALFYAINAKLEQRILFLFKLENEFQLPYDIQIDSIELQKGITGFQFLVITRQFDVIKKISDTQLILLRNEIEKNDFFINYLLQNNLYDETIVNIQLSCIQESQLLSLIEDNIDTLFYQNIVKKLQFSIAFHRFVLKSKKFPESQVQISKLFLLDKDTKALKQIIGEDQVQILQLHREQNRIQESSNQVESSQSQQAVSNQQQQISSYNQSAMSKKQPDEQNQFYQNCASGTITGLERFVGLQDQRQQDIQSQIYPGFTGLFYAIQAQNITNMAILMDKESKINLNEDITYLLDKNEIILKSGTSSIQFSILFKLESNFPHSISIPKDSTDYFLYANRFPISPMDASQINYCLTSDKKNIIQQLYQRNISEQTAISMLQSDLKIEDIYVYIAKFYYSKDVQKALIKKSGLQYIIKRDNEEMKKSISSQSSKDFQPSLMKDILEKNLTGVKEKFRTEKYSITWRDASVASKFLPRGTTILHLLPFTSLEIVQFVMDKKDYIIDFQLNRFNDSFIDIAMQTISNSAFVILKQYGPQYIEKNFKYSLSRIVQFENAQMLDTLIKFIHRLKLKPLEQLDPVFVDFNIDSKFQKAALDALYCQKLCLQLRDQPESVDKAIILQANAGIMKWRGDYKILNQFIELAKETDIAIFEGFDCINGCMEDKWEAVGDLVNGELGEDMEDMFEQDDLEQKQKAELIRQQELEIERQRLEAERLVQEKIKAEEELQRQQIAKAAAIQAAADAAKKVEYNTKKLAVKGKKK